MYLPSTRHQNLTSHNGSGKTDKKNWPVIESLPCGKRANSESCKEEKNRELPFPQLLCWSDYSQLKKIKFIVHKVKLQDALNCLKFKIELYVYVNLREKKRSQLYTFSLCPWSLHECVSENKYTWIHLGNTEFYTDFENWRLPFFKHQTIFTLFFFSFYQHKQKYKIVIVLFSATSLPLTHSFVFNYIKTMLLIFQDS